MSECTDALDDHLNGIQYIDSVFILGRDMDGTEARVYDAEATLLHTFSGGSLGGCTVHSGVSTKTQDAGVFILVDGAGDYFTAKYASGSLGSLQPMSSDLGPYITQSNANCLLSDDGTKLVFTNQNFE